MKIIRIGFKTAFHDFQTKAKNVKEFLERSHKVKIEMRLFGREKNFINLAKEKMEKFLELLKNLIDIKIEKELKEESIGLTMIISKK